MPGSSDTEQSFLLAAAARHNSCEAALTRARTFQTTEEDVKLLQEDAQRYSHVAGCTATYLGARAVYHEQLKASLDAALDIEIEDARVRFGDHPEIKMLVAASQILRSRSGQTELSEGRDLLRNIASRLPSGKKTHIELLLLIAEQRLAAPPGGAPQRRNLASLGLANAFPNGLPVAARQVLERFGIAVDA